MPQKHIDKSQCAWGKINDFSSYEEFENFVSYLNEQVESKVAEEIVVQEKYSGCDFREKWFLHKESGRVWRLVWPEVPFTGVFDLVSINLNVPLEEEK